MSPTAAVVAFIAGIILLGYSIYSLLSWGLVYRQRAWQARRSTTFDRTFWAALRAIGARTKDDIRREQILSLMIPLVMITLLFIRILVLMLAWTLILWAISPDPFIYVLREAASATVTLNLITPRQASPATIDVLAAMSGLAVVAFSIGYLPVIRQAMSDQVTHLFTLDARIGSPPLGPNILIEAAQRDDIDGLADFFAQWKDILAANEDRVASYPVLGYLRSPVTYSGPLVGSLAVADAAALYIAIAPEIAPANCHRCLDSAKNSLTGIRQKMGIKHGSCSGCELPRSEFDHAVDMLESEGFPVTEGADAAWPTFCALRSKYSHDSHLLGDYLLSPETAWTMTATACGAVDRESDTASPKDNT